MKELTYNQLHNLIMEAINESGLSIEECYGCISSIEAKVRYVMLGDMREKMIKSMKEDEK